MIQSNNPEMKSYFSSLPHFLQEAIQQSSIEITSVEQLKSVAENLQAQSKQDQPWH
ncbi:hypothetical protein [Clostridium minihomine]|uniref:hypothetical protein n=1 Tax=Clostridium minihomine TaxID=2045012 RepID=UPI0013EB2663|nr:hypothetical protein [Clostridium minihomine]